MRLSTLPLLLTCMPTTAAMAQEMGEDLPEDTETEGTDWSLTPVPTERGYAFDGVAPVQGTTQRNYQMEFSFRGRIVSIPKSLVDVEYYDADDNGWPYIEPRPKFIGYALGLEYVVKGQSSNGIFYVQFMDSEIKSGYWDPVDDEVEPNHLDGDYLHPSPGLGVIAYGANYAYEAHIVRTSDTQGRFGFSYLVGGGLGMGVLTGRMEQWGPDDKGNPAYKRFLDGEDPDEDKRLPRIFPMVDINMGFRFNLGDRLVFRVEGGTNTLLYYGVTAGVPF